MNNKKHKMEHPPWTDRIAIDSKIHFGKPCVAGSRILVEHVLELIEENISFEDITKNYYPDIEIDDIKACVRYAADIVRMEEIHINTVS